MAEVEEQISLAEEAESLAQRYVLKELVLLENLRQAVEAESVTRLRSKIREFAMLEQNLWSAHQNAIAQIQILKKAQPSDVDALTARENEIDAAVTTFFNTVDVRTSNLYNEVLADKPNFTVLAATITAAESSLRDWIRALKSLQEEFRVTKAEYKKALPGVKVTDLLSGKGYYAQYTVEQRKDLWNRWSQTMKQRNLAGFNLEKSDLRGFDFSGFQLQKANFEGTNLTGVNFTGANLEAAELPDLAQVTLNGAILRKATFNGSMHDVTAINADFSNAKFPFGHSIIGRCDLRGSKFNGTIFNEYGPIRFLVVNLSGASLVGAMLYHVEMEGVDLSRADLHEANLEHAIISSMGPSFYTDTLKNSDLSNVDLRNANLTHAMIFEANLTGAKFSGAQLRDADFERCIISKGAFSEEQMKEITLDRFVGKGEEGTKFV